MRISDYGFTPLPRGVPNESEKRVKRPLRLGFVGTLVWHKGVHVLLEAIRGLRPDAYELNIFGDPAVFPAYTAQLRAQAAGLPVHFAGAFERVAAARVYANMDVLVVPSLWLENSPLVIHEAFMSGVPVVGARIGGIADLLTDEQRGLLYAPPDSPAALESVLRGLIENPDRLGRFAKSLPRVKSMAEDAEQWEGIYADLVAQRAARTAP